MKVLLLGNYSNDAIQSMELFVLTLLRELPREGVRAELIRPIPFFGRLRRSATGLGKWLGYIDKFLIFPVILRFKVWRLSRAASRLSHSLVVHICDQSNAHYTRHLRGTPHLVTCNDLLAIRSARGEIPQHRTGWTGKRLQALIVGGLKRAMRVACISGATRDDFLRITGMAPERVSVIYMGQNHGYAPADTREAADHVRSLLPDVRRFIFHVGSNTWYKNRMGLLRIYRALRDSASLVPPLVMAGQPFNAEILEFISSNGLGETVFNVIGVSNEELRALYTSAELLVFPSIAEGFGWPIIEAQACGCRVVTSNRAPMTEVGGDAAFYIDPEKPTEAAAVIAALLNQDSVSREAAIKRGFENASRFPTEAMIRDYRRTYEDLILSCESE